MKLAETAEGHAPTLSNVLRIDPSSVNKRLLVRGAQKTWLSTRRKRRQKHARETRLRFWWRERLRALGIDPMRLSVDDPLWPACHKRPRGALVRLAHAELQRETPGAPPTDEYLERVLARVAELEDLTEGERAERFDALGVK